MIFSGEFGGVWECRAGLNKQFEDAQFDSGGDFSTVYSDLIIDTK